MCWQTASWNTHYLYLLPIVIIFQYLHPKPDVSNTVNHFLYKSFSTPRWLLPIIVYLCAHIGLSLFPSKFPVVMTHSSFLFLQICWLSASDASNQFVSQSSLLFYLFIVFLAFLYRSMQVFRSWFSPLEP